MTLAVKTISYMKDEMSWIKYDLMGILRFSFHKILSNDRNREGKKLRK